MARPGKPTAEPKRVFFPDLGLPKLSDEEKAAIDKVAAADVDEERRKRDEQEQMLARQAYLSQRRSELRQQHSLVEPLVEITIDIPDKIIDACPYILINNMRYDAGVTYTVPLSVYETLADIVYRIGDHVRISKGEDKLGAMRRGRRGSVIAGRRVA
ncbi:MAG: hypothetical protein C4555_04340 [Dehalococcoidia bacterium]|nr:MAG: hypothetical protein C4555_04340 [Dehalococcoidia bacterium]